MHINFESKCTIVSLINLCRSNQGQCHHAERNVTPVLFLSSGTSLPHAFVFEKETVNLSPES